MRVAIVGAGIAGLACAEALVARGAAAVLFDKGRAPGGRMATRRVATPLGEARFDHGAQYFTVRDPAFGERVARWRGAGQVMAWAAAGDDAWVGAPTMSAPVRAMAERLDVRSGARVDRVERHARGWRLQGEGIEAATFDALVLAVPAEQVAPLIAPFEDTFAARAVATPSQPCWTLMAAFAAPLRIATDVVRGRGPVGWAARDSAKPGRGGPESWVVQADPAWSTAHLERPADAVATELLAALFDVLAVASQTPLTLAAHRWRFARAGAAETPLLWNPDLRVGVCGDWLLGPRVECAWIAGDALGRAIARA